MVEVIGLLKKFYFIFYFRAWCSQKDEVFLYPITTGT